MSAFRRCVGLAAWSLGLFPVNGWAALWSVGAFSGDADCGVSAAKIYTHAVNVNGGDVTVNGVLFRSEAATLGSNWTIDAGFGVLHAGRPSNLSGQIRLVATPFRYEGNPQTMTLHGLTAGNEYILTWYGHGWGGPGRWARITEDAGGSSLDVDENQFGDGNGILIVCRYRARDASARFTIVPFAGPATFHLYGFSNEAVILDNAEGATRVGYGGATLHGVLHATNGPTSVFCFWGERDGGNSATDWSHAVALGASPAGSLATRVTGLPPSSAFFYRYYASNGAWQAWAGSSSRFGTPSHVWSAWTRRMKVEFRGYTNRVSAVTDFPALVTLGEHIAGFRYADFRRPGGWDLRFSDRWQNQELPYEVASGDEDGKTRLWVRVDELASPRSGVWVYWGNRAATRPAYTTNGAVWASGFNAVWHLDEGAGPIRDSVAGLTGTAFNVATVTGLVGRAASFNGSSSRIATGYGQPSVDAYTVSAWVRSTAGLGAQIILEDRGAGPGLSLTLGFGRAGPGLPFYALDSNSILIGREALTGTIHDGRWHHVAGTWAGQRGNAVAPMQFAVYADGVQLATGDLATGAAVSPLAGSGASQMGTHAPWGTRLAGALDEVRAASAMRTGDWIWAEWMNAASNAAFNAMGRVIESSVGTALSVH